MNFPISGKAISLQNRVRFVTATSLFDGHDAAINIMRRIMQSQGVEVIHLGHDRGVEEIVGVAIEEDVQGIAVSSYQGGHNEFFRYMIDLLREKGADHIHVFGGGGGVIIPSEIIELTHYGVSRIYSPQDGREMGLAGMVADMVGRADFPLFDPGFSPDITALKVGNHAGLSRAISWIEHHGANTKMLQEFLKEIPENAKIPVIGITGTGGAGKSCITDEIVRRFVGEFPEKPVAVVSVDPSKRKTGGALLGDRMRMNAIFQPRVFMRSVATRRSHRATSESLHIILRVLRSAGFGLILVETAGIGQSDSEITDLADLSVYVMTPEFGAATQLEKIDMLDFADCIVVNKFDKPGAEDALNSVWKHYRRAHQHFENPVEELPVFGVCANHFNDRGANWFYHRLLGSLISKKKLGWKRRYKAEYAVAEKTELIPAESKDYLRQIAATVRNYKQEVRDNALLAADCGELFGTLRQLAEKDDGGRFLAEKPGPVCEAEVPRSAKPVARLFNSKWCKMPDSVRMQLAEFEELRASYRDEVSRYQVRGRKIEVSNHISSLSGLKIPKIATPNFRSWGEIVRWLGLENYPGRFPYTAGVFPFKRENEDPTRMFAGEGIAERTNRRFHLLAKDQPANRLSTAFDSVTLYGEDPHRRPDIFGKIGNAGVSVCTLDDAKRLYSGFDLTKPNTSVSMTINGPAPMVLAFFVNAAIDQQVEHHLRESGLVETVRNALQARFHEKDLAPPEYRMELPEDHNRLGLGLLGMSGCHFVSEETYVRIRQDVLQSMRGTVQADILKEDQAQNTCIFSTNFALRMMGDIQEYFTQNQVRNFYSVSISGYHIAEAGANPITQVAFTLANGFTIIEYYLARGLPIDGFAGNLSYFFSNGMDPEYAVIGRVARRIFAITLRDLYGADVNSQKLKYHIQTSGRSLHAMEIDFNDIRTTLQALYAIYDNCNSLHTNAYDEAITTPTEDSVRRALAIQLIINQELGEAYNQNPLQGSFIIEELTELVEEAILSEFVRLSERGGVLGAMETMYQRNKIQEESLHYEALKHSGELPIMGVNTFLNPQPQAECGELELARSTEEEKRMQIRDLEVFQSFHAQEADRALSKLRDVVLHHGNTFAAFLECAGVCSLGQVTTELFRLGGQYRRNM